MSESVRMASLCLRISQNPFEVMGGFALSSSLLFLSLAPVANISPCLLFVHLKQVENSNRTISYEHEYYFLFFTVSDMAHFVSWFVSFFTHDFPHLVSFCWDLHFNGEQQIKTHYSRPKHNCLPVHVLDKCPVSAKKDV